MTDIINILNDRIDLRVNLFRYGWLWMQERLDNRFINGYPFYEEWREVRVGRYYVYLHKNARFTAYDSPLDDSTLVLLGHAYNPFTMDSDEHTILKDIAAKSGDESNYIDKINELTGVFIFIRVKDDEIMLISDPASMLPAFYGTFENKIVISSHSQLIADIYNLHLSDIAKELIRYKWYPRLPGAYLPADLSPFSELKRVVANHVYYFDNNNMTHKRIYPIAESQNSDTSYEDTIKYAAQIMKNNLALIATKWDHPYISLTGGIDSNTTFAAANGLYNRIHSFSYISAGKEEPDAKAAEIIASTFNSQFTLIRIPERNDEIHDYLIKAEIINHNNAYSNPINEAEMRKRIVMSEQDYISCEIKSWVSETFRAPLFHRYRRKSMPPLSAKLFRNLYKIFVSNRSLAHKVDKIFQNFINDFEYDIIPEQFNPSDMFFHECEWGSWGGICISDMKLGFDITIPYNNRKLIDSLLRLPLEVRLNDRHHLDIKKLLNEELFNMNIHVANVNETKTRGRLLNLIFTANMISPV